MQPARKTSLANLARDFEAHLKKAGKSNNTIRNYMSVTRRFVRFVGNQQVDRIGADTVKAFFKELPSDKNYYSVIGQFLRFSAAGLPVLVGRGSGVAPASPSPTKKEVALRQTWALDRLVEKKQSGDDLIAKLARKVIDHYLYFQSRMKGELENLDDIYRFADECRELIESNLALFMQLSAKGINVHSKIDERVQR